MKLVIGLGFLVASNSVLAQTADDSNNAEEYEYYYEYYDDPLANMLGLGRSLSGEVGQQRRKKKKVKSTKPKFTDPTPPEEAHKNIAKESLFNVNDLSGFFAGSNLAAGPTDRPELGLPLPVLDEAIIEAGDENYDYNDLSDASRGWQKYFIDPPKNADLSGISCSAAKKQPNDGSLRCSNGEDNIGHGDSCQIRCAKGFVGSPYTVLNCAAKEDTRTGEIVGMWDQKKAASCVAKDEVEVTEAPTQATTTTTTTAAPYATKKPKKTVATTTTTTQAPTTTTMFVPTTTKRKIKVPKGQTAAYFPFGSTFIPDGFYNLNVPIAMTDDDPLITELEAIDKYTNHNQVLAYGKCMVCNNVKSLKKCVQAKQTCNLKDGQVCYTEIRKTGNNLVINRGCMKRSNCLHGYFRGINYNGNESYLSKNGYRPDRQCREMAASLAQGVTLMSSNNVIDNKSCYSCHQLAMSVPFL